MLQKTIVMAISLLSLNAAFAKEKGTDRLQQILNEKVKVWQTTILTGKKQILKMHRHEHDRVIVPFDDGTLKITNDKGEVHHLKLKKGVARFLPKDIPGEMHNDENISGHTVTVTVVELLNPVETQKGKR